MCTLPVMEVLLYYEGLWKKRFQLCEQDFILLYFLNEEIFKCGFQLQQVWQIMIKEIERAIDRVL